jgi:hypothetical protein
MNRKLIIGKSLIQKLALLSILLIPVFNIGEIIALFVGSVVRDSPKLETPPYVKLLKDFIFILIILISGVEIILKKTTNKIFLLLLPILATLFISVLINSNGLVILLAGMKWILPIVLIFFLLDKIDLLFLSKVASTLYIVFWIHFGIQILQFFFMPTFYGVSYFGYSARNPGIFAMPSTASFLAVLLVFFNFFYAETNKKKLVILSTLSIMLTGSGTGVAAMLLFYLFYFIHKRFYNLLYVSLPFLGFLFPFLIILISGRSDVFSESGMVRVNLFMKILAEAKLVSTNFGMATNNASLLLDQTGGEANLISTDSAISMILANFGLGPFFIFLFFYFSWMGVVFYNKNKELICFSLIFSIFAITTSLTESFPGNLLFAVLFAFYSPRVIKFS